MKEEVIDVLHDFSERTKKSSILISITLLLTIFITFFTDSSPILSGLGKLIVIILLLVIFVTSVKNTNLIAEKVDNLFLDPSVSSIRNNVILSYIFSLATLVLIYYIIKSFFN